jgi:hypothetical protein
MKTILVTLSFLTLFISACGPTQKITSSWANPEPKSKGPYNKVFVIVMSENSTANYNIEDQMATTLISRGFKVVRSTDIFPPKISITQDLTREQLTEAIAKRGCDAVLTLALLDSKSVESYHPGTTYAPVNYGYYGSFYGYYNYYYPVVYSPGYYSVDKTYYLETNLYSLATDELLWSVQSVAKNPKDVNSWFKNYAVMLTRHLKSKGLSQRKDQ